MYDRERPSAGEETTLEVLLPLLYSTPGDAQAWGVLLDTLRRLAGVEGVLLHLDSPWSSLRSLHSGVCPPRSPSLQLPLAEYGSLTLYIDPQALFRVHALPWLQPLQQHLIEALSCHEELCRNAQLARLTLRELPRRFGFAVLLVDGSGRLLDQLGTTEGPTLPLGLALSLRQGRLHLSQGDAQRRLTQGLREALAHGERRHLTLALIGHTQPISLLIHPLGRRGAPARRALLAMSLPLTPEQRLRGLSIFSFTKREGELVHSLIGGLDLETHARNHNISLNTVRSQLRRVYAKTATRRQGQLMARLMLTLPAEVSPLRL